MLNASEIQSADSTKNQKDLTLFAFYQYGWVLQTNQFVRGNNINQMPINQYRSASLFLGYVNSSITSEDGKLVPNPASFSDGFEISISPSCELVMNRASLVVQPGFFSRLSRRVAGTGC
ncbi:MAG: hypothetical protein A2X05_02235 [Bacteroidetes bacterium GWE2_41_25]|nr:MAG: hypothetical protein A2X03_10785 [Bacteroidetes bacterium GWA2_40_15]OFX85425.1 MAG: hypothetical protein A2X06_10320 [Bacteroidetes bacterium GWC2_40_22]OFY10384.1 MAG: hypothetical protein A2X05_02235 [Bacteroidetes bacterium GWE2_41_25]OFY58274.1 MAG: hypothetical protein A2X04_07465 [Bacteroidetes bacterium GWF2_41_9]HBH83845.1 hypothetical protein [Bacteroidales bacterium]